MRVLPFIAILYMAGIAVGLFLPVSRDLVPLISAAAVALLGFSVFTRARVLFACAAAAFFLGWLRPAPSPEPPRAPEAVTCPRAAEGTVTASVATPEGRHRLTLDLSRCSACLEGPPRDLFPASGRLFLTILNPSGRPPQKGEEVRLMASLSPVQSHSNPGSSPQRLDRPAFTGVVDDGNDLLRTGRRETDLFAFTKEARARIVAFWNEHLPPGSARMARALAIGDSGALDMRQRRAFRDTGAAHLLAVSGLHLGVVALFCFGVTRWILTRIPPLARRWDVGAAAALVTLAPVVLFAALTGGRPPVLRALVMVSCALIGRASGRISVGAATLSVAALILLTEDPGQLASPGFQLSFAAVAGFLLALRRPAAEPAVEPPVAPILQEAPSTLARVRAGLLRKTRSLIASCACAFAATAPFTAYHFGQVSIASVPVNIVAVPLVAFLLTPALLAVSLLSLAAEAPAALLAHPLGWLLNLLEAALGLVARAPCVWATAGPLAVLATGLFCAGVLAALTRRIRLAAPLIAAGSLLLIAGIGPSADHLEDGVLTVDFLDVGQGDSTLVSFPNGARWLVDAGGTARGEENIGPEHILPILESLGVHELDALVLTHPDPDHVVGMPAVLEALPVRRVIDNGQGEEEGACPAYAKLLRLAREKGVPILGPKDVCGESTMGEVALSFLHPCDPDTGYDPGLSFNDNSMVIMLTLGRARVLLPGDLGREGEFSLLRRGVSLDSAVLKLGHHGSAGSSSEEFLDAVRPMTAVASCALGNRFGMPHARVRRLLSRRGTTLMRTDLQGSVRLRTDGRVISIGPLKPPEE